MLRGMTLLLALGVTVCACEKTTAASPTQTAPLEVAVYAKKQDPRLAEGFAKGKARLSSQKVMRAPPTRGPMWGGAVLELDGTAEEFVAGMRAAGFEVDVLSNPKGAKWVNLSAAELPPPPDAGTDAGS